MDGSYQTVYVEVIGSVVVDPRVIQVDEVEEIGPHVVFLFHVVVETLQQYTMEIITIKTN